MGKNCARGLEYGPRAVLKTKGTVFSHTDRPSPVKQSTNTWVCLRTGGPSAR